MNGVEMFKWSFEETIEGTAQEVWRLAGLLEPILAMESKKGEARELRRLKELVESRLAIPAAVAS
jgi:hypothetical protein